MRDLRSGTPGLEPENGRCLFMERKREGGMGGREEDEGKREGSDTRRDRKKGREQRGNGKERHDGENVIIIMMLMIMMMHSLTFGIPKHPRTESVKVQDRRRCDLGALGVIWKLRE